jgi:hypothetical protein
MGARGVGEQVQGIREAPEGRKDHAAALLGRWALPLAQTPMLSLSSYS